MSRLWLCGALLMLVSSPVAADPGWQQVRTAETTMQASDIPPLGASWRTVTLPDQWFRDQRWEQGLTGWYRIALPDRQPARQQALYLQRISTNVRVYFNEQYIGSGGSFDEPVARNMHRPLFFPLPTSGWRSAHNYVYVHLRVYPGYAHLAAARLGDVDALRPIYDQQHFVQVTLSQVFFAVVLLTAAFGAIFYAFFDRQPSNLYFTLTALGWSTYCLNLFIRDIPIPAKLWWVLIHANLEWTGVFLVLFVHRLLRVHRHWFERCLIAGATIATITYLLTPLVDINATVRVFHLGLLIVVGYLSVWLLWHYSRTRNTDALVVGLCLLVVGGLGINDFVRQAAPIDSPNWQTPYYLLQFGAPMMFIILASYITSRYVTAQRRAAAAEVRQRVARQHERERIFQDLHDDVGAKLLTLVYRTEGSDNQALAREALQEIREIVGGHTAQAGLLAEILNPYLHEARQRCTDAGITLVAHHEIPPSLEVSGECSYHLAKIIRELVSNTLKHADARNAELSLGFADEALVLSYSDDGKGLPPDATPGLGLAGLRRRCQSLDGQFDLREGDGFSCQATIRRWASG